MDKKQEIKKLNDPITTSELQGAGIQSVITQSDIIDIIAEESLENIRKKVEEFNKEYDEQIYSFYTDLYQKPINAFAKKIGADPNYIGMEVKGLYDPLRCEKIELLELDGRVEEYIIREKDNCYRSSIFIPCKDKEIEIILRYTLSDSKASTIEKKKEYTIEEKIITEKKYNTSFKIDYKQVEKLVENADNWNKRVREYITSVSVGGRIKPALLAKRAKVKLNKRILQSQAPEIREKLGKLFNIVL